MGISRISVRISRRRLLGLLASGALGAFASACGPLLRAPVGREGDLAPEIKAGSISPVLAQGDSAAEAGGMAVPKSGHFTLGRGVSEATYTSPVYQADLSFNGIALSCAQRAPEGTQVAFEMRASPDGGQWSDWLSARQACGASTEKGVFRSQLIGVNGRYLQYRLTLAAPDTQDPPSVERIKIDYFDSSRGPSAPRPPGAPPGRRPADVSEPSIISRAGWGCPEPWSSGWVPSYKDWTKIALHDTVTKNDDPNPAATVRAIWYYHANTLGWGDIGYNYLIDTLGNIYEGRFGGENATGGHVLACYNPGSIGIALLGDYRYADVTPAMTSALISLLAAKTYQHNIDPLGAGNFGGPNYDGTYSEKWLNNIFAHRDVYGSCGNTHTDPGTWAFNRMQEFRTGARDGYVPPPPALPPYGEAWVSNNSPARMLTASAATVAVTVKNTGGVLWSVADKFRLGYRWFGSGGAEVIQAGGGFQRAELPSDVASGQTVTINAPITAPAAAGTYTLQWDMLQEGVTWFASQGNSPLNAGVSVEEPTYVAELTAQAAFGPLLPGGKQAAWVELRNAGTATWYRGGPNPVKLGTWSPADRASALATPGDWESPSRPTVADQDAVRPGQVVRFTFIVKAPNTPAVYREHFRLIAEGKGWFAPDMYMDITVLRAIRTYLPEITQKYNGSW